MFFPVLLSTIKSPAISGSPIISSSSRTASSPHPRRRLCRNGDRRLPQRQGHKGDTARDEPYAPGEQADHSRLVDVQAPEGSRWDSAAGRPRGAGHPARRRRRRVVAAQAHRGRARRPRRRARSLGRCPAHRWNLLLAPGELLFQQGPPQDLAHQGLRKLGAKFDMPGGLVGSQSLTAELDYLLFGGGLALLQDHVRFYRLSPVLVGDAHGDRFLYLGVLVEDLVDLARVDVEAAGDYHVFLAVDNIKVAILVHGGDITGVKPPVLERFRGLLGLVPVALHHLGPADEELSGLVDAELQLVVVDVHYPAVRVGEWEAHRADFLHPQDGVRVGYRRGFGQPVTLAEYAPGDVAELLKHLHRQRGRAAVAELYLVDPVRESLRMVQDGGIDGWHTREEGWLVCLYRLKHHVDLELRYEEHGRGVENRVVHRHGLAVRVEERYHAEVDILAPLGELPGPCAYLECVRQEVPVGEHDTLGHAGGPACILQCGQVLQRVDLDVRDIRRRLRYHIEEVVGIRSFFGGRFHRRLHVVGDAGYDAPLERNILLDSLDAGMEEVEVDHGLGARVVELVLYLPLDVQRADVGDHPASLQDAVIRDEHLRAVCQHERDSVTLPDPHVGQRGSHAPRFVLQLGVGHLLVEEYRGYVVLIEKATVLQDLLQGYLRVTNWSPARSSRSFRAILFPFEPPLTHADDNNPKTLVLTTWMRKRRHDEDGRALPVLLAEQ